MFEIHCHASFIFSYKFEQFPHYHMIITHCTLMITKLTAAAAIKLFIFDPKSVKCFREHS